MAAATGQDGEPKDGAERAAILTGSPSARAGFDAFFDSIWSAALRAVALQWRNARGCKRMPAWKDIDPAAMPAQLPIIWSWKYERDADAFTGRLAGEDIIALIGRNLRGASMKNVFAQGTYDSVFARCKRIVAEPSFIHSHGKIFTSVGRIGCGERIGLPLSEDGRNGDGIIGATAYQIMPISASCRCAAEGFCGEAIEFFPVD
jgi:hypothetical protein